VSELTTVIQPIGLGPSTSKYSDPVERIVWPQPEVAAVEIQPGTGKPAVEDLCRLARAFGWSMRVTEACGCWPSVGQRPSVQRWSQAIRMWRGQERAVAVYVEDAGGKTWKWMTFYRWTIGAFPDSEANVNHFLDGLFGPPCKPMWPGANDWSCPYFGPVHGPVKPPRVR
jgi:hypothetical protein